MLMSSETSAAVDSAFNTLAQTVLVQNARTLEDLVREMLRPMLKAWLDDNLPGMVERLVRAEIERVSRGRTRLNAVGCAELSAKFEPSGALERGGEPQGLVGQHRRLLLDACRRLQRHAVLARNDVDMQVKHHLAAGGLVELLNGETVGGKHRHGRPRDRLRRP